MRTLILIMGGGFLLLALHSLGGARLDTTWWPNVALVLTMASALYGRVPAMVGSVLFLGYLTDLMAGTPTGAYISVLVVVLVLIRLVFARNHRIWILLLPLLSAVLAPVALIGVIFMAGAMSRSGRIPLPGFLDLLLCSLLNGVTGLAASFAARWAFGEPKSDQRQGLDIR